MILSIYNALMIPHQFSFALPFEFLRINSYLDLTIDILFLLDNLLMFFTSFQNQHGTEISNHYEIYLNYTRSIRFYFDSLSLLGFYFFKQIAPAFKYFQLFKATRVFRLSVMVNGSVQPLEIKGLLKIAILVLNLFIYIHWLACFLNLVVWYNAPAVYFVQESGLYLKKIGGQVLTDSMMRPLNYTGADFIYAEAKFNN